MNRRDHVLREVRRDVGRVRSRLRTIITPPPGPSAHPSPQSAALLAALGPRDPQAPSPRVVLLDDCRDQINFGACVLMDGLVESLLESLPNATILPIPSHWLLDVSNGFGAFLEGGLGLRQPWTTFPEVADQFETLGDDWISGRGDGDAQEFIDRFAGADLVVLNGEGSIYRTNASAVRELFLAWFARERLGIPTVFINGTIHLTDVVPILPAMVRKTLEVMDAVAVREPFTLRNLEQFAPEISAQLVPDSAFVFSAQAARESAAVREIRQRVGPVDYFCFDPGAMHMDHREPHRSGLYDLICRLKQVVPQAVLVNSSPADAYIENIARETNSVYVDTITDYREYMKLVQGAQFAVTGRYHNPILAAIVGTPSVTFASANHKVHGACEMLDGLIGSPFDGTYLRPSLDAIEARARSYVEDRDGIRSKLIEVCARRRVGAMELGRIAARALDTWPADSSGSADRAL